ncbi:hypothetical protein BV898_09596 [Hypsibius exemplaris]|uniref:Uncharacterized protein n=1 Tax=Hypsibius exemplaris TaxID=2072580 RepID=A0A1W0WM59_HYPEX|nr:hypothetical protein BV898_09596 [Hypsibius exemplaris]
MGCGLSQLSKTQRVRVWDLSSSGGTSLKSISTGPDMTGNQPSVIEADHHAAKRPQSNRSSSSAGNGAKKGSTLTPSPAKVGPTQTPTGEVNPARIKTPDPRQTKSAVVESPVKPAIEPGAPRPKSSMAGATDKDRGRSSVSVKSFSDQDSGYKDDSQPEEGDDGRLSISPWKELKMPGTNQNLSDDSEFEEPFHPQQPRTGLDQPKRASLQGSACGLLHRRHSIMLTEGSDDENGDVLKRPASTSGSARPSPIRTTLCSCGFSHQKPDGYVETYSDDNGYLDSSYEDMRSLAHDGSVFSIDILCHTTQDGSHRAHRIPLYVHKPIATHAGAFGEAGGGSHNKMIHNAAAHAQAAPLTPLAPRPTTAQRPANPFDFQHHFHHARAQVTNCPLKATLESDSSGTSVGDERIYHAGTPLHGAGNSFRLGGTRRRHMSTGNGLPSDYMLHQLDHYEQLLNQRHNTLFNHEPGATFTVPTTFDLLFRPKGSHHHNNEEDIKSLHD